jgi:transcriptional regulator with XRE-family HTH domain
MMENEMGVKLAEIMDRLPEGRRRKVEVRADELIAEEMSLRELRKALGKTQAAVAKKLGMKQENVSRIEQRADVLLSTLNGYLRSLGGNLRLVVEFKDRGPVTLAGFRDRKVFKPSAPSRKTAKGRQREVETA